MGLLAVGHVGHSLESRVTLEVPLHSLYQRHHLGKQSACEEQGVVAITHSSGTVVVLSAEKRRMDKVQGINRPSKCHQRTKLWITLYFVKLVLWYGHSPSLVWLWYPGWLSGFHPAAEPPHDPAYRRAHVRLYSGSTANKMDERRDNA